MDKLQTVQNLLDRANHPDTPDGEREACLAKADALMFRHKIDEAQLRAKAGDKSAKVSLNLPVHEKFEWVSKDDEFYQVHCLVIMALSDLCEVKMVICGQPWGGRCDLSVFGMTADVRYFRSLWTGSYLTFSNKLYPHWDRNLSDGENIKALAESGMKWVDMWTEARKVGALGDVKCPPGDNGKMKRLYAKACKDAGEEKMQLRHAKQGFRDSYALAFAQTIAERASRLRYSRAQQDVGGAALVLKSDADAIENLVRETYPNLTYGEASGREMSGGVGAGAERGRAAGASVDFTAGGMGSGAAPAAGISAARRTLSS